MLKEIERFAPKILHADIEILTQSNDDSPRLHRCDEYHHEKIGHDLRNDDGPTLYCEKKLAALSAADAPMLGANAELVSRFRTICPSYIRSCFLYMCYVHIYGITRCAIRVIKLISISIK